LAGSVDEAGFLADCKVEYNGEVIQPKNKDELQMLLARIVKAELGHSDTMENDLAAQKAQAIASYTYILYYNQTNKKPCPVSMKSINLNNGIDKKIYDAVGEVVGIKILEKGSPICAVYSASTPEKGSPICAVYSASTPGHTANNHEVYRYGKNLKYLYSVPSVYEDRKHMPKIAKWNTEFTISMEELETKLEEKYGNIGFESGSAPFYVRKYDKNGQYVLETNAYYYKNGVKTYISGHEMRAAIGSTSLRSHAFKVISSTQTTLTLDVYGYGHGIGLSQWGAANYARHAGWDYKQILSHYYSITQTSAHRLYAPVW
jgi:stage II sporulation protein D